MAKLKVSNIFNPLSATAGPGPSAMRARSGRVYASRRAPALRAESCPPKADNFQANITSACPADTARLAGLFAAGLKGGDALFLEGPIGSGKTFFVRELAAALGAKKLPVSASFNLMRAYKGRLKLYHFDLFRAGEADMENIGLDEYLGRVDGITAVEWPAAAGTCRTEPIRVEFELAGGDRRVIKITAGPTDRPAMGKIEAKWLKR